MEAAKLVGVFGARSARIWTKKPRQRDDDVADRLSNKYTVMILVCFAIVVGMHQYIGKPVTCWAPKHFTKSFIKYATSYCWVKNTYYLHWQQLDIPRDDAPKRYIFYYQWLPFILLGQAVLFFLPSMVWHVFNSKAGVDADDILNAAASMSKCTKGESHEKTLDVISRQMTYFFSSRNSKGKGRFISRREGSYLIYLYILSKFCYLANILFQLFILNNILSTRFSIFGFEVLSHYTHDPFTPLSESLNATFPKVTMCDFVIRRLGNLNRYTVQCVLPINLYAEKVFIFLWFWFVFVLIATALSLLVWIVRAVLQSDRVKFVKNHLLQRRDSGSGELITDVEIKEFVSRNLQQDGAFILRLIAHNNNSITVTDIIGKLWDQWVEKVAKEENKEERNEDISEINDENEPKNVLEKRRLYPKLPNSN